jgi:hypothetical protein
VPEQAFHSLGDTLTQALLQGDFALYRSVLTLPVRFTPRGGKPYLLQDDAALRADFDLYVAIIRLHGVTDIYRQVVGYDAIGDDAVSVRLVTHILVRATRLVEPFPSRMVMRRDATGWRIAEIESSEGHLNWTMGRATVSSAGRFVTKDMEG